MFKNIGLRVTNFEVLMPTPWLFVPLCAHLWEGDGILPSRRRWGPRRTGCCRRPPSQPRTGTPTTCRTADRGGRGERGQRDLQKWDFMDLKKKKYCEGRKELAHTTTVWLQLIYFKNWRILVPNILWISLRTRTYYTDLLPPPQYFIYYCIICPPSPRFHCVGRCLGRT